METLVYECYNCGKQFYFYGRQAEDMRSYMLAACNITIYSIHNPPLMCQLLELKVKCCNHPYLGIRI